MSSAVDDNTDAAMNGPEARSQNDVDGTGIKIGILSYSFDTQGGAAADVADGDLPASGVTVLSEGAVASNDEGRAMAEMIHKVAPGAQIYFASVGSSDASYAAAIQSLQAAGVNVMVDGYRFADEPFFQDGGAVQAAAHAAVAAGITYVTAAGNLGAQFYQEKIVMAATTLPGGLGSASAFDFNLGQGTPNPLQSLTIPLNSTLSIDLQWDQPFKTIGKGAGSTFTLNLYLYNSANQIVAEATQSALGGNPVQTLFSYQNTTGSTAFHLAITAGNGVPTGTLKYIVLDDSGVVINDPNAGQGSGTLIGQEMNADAITVGDVAYANTPQAGGTLKLQTDTSVGPAEEIFDANGNRLATPLTLNKVDVVAPVGSATSVTGLSPYYGTSGAAANVAGVVALMLQANPNLKPADIDALLRDSALSVGSGPSTAAGSGFVQADRAVAFARTGNITMATGGTRVLYGTSQPTNFAVGTGTNYISLGSGPSLVVSAGTDTVIAGAGTATVAVAGAGAVVFGGSAALVMSGGAGANTVFGGAGAETISGGTGSGTYFGGTGGGNVLVAGAQQSILVAGGNGDQLFAAGGGTDILFGATGGNIVMGAGASTAGNTYLALGSNALIGTGVGLNTVFLGNGSDVVFDNGADTVIGGTGNATVAVGTGSVFMEAGSGKTLISPGSGANTVFGTTGSETVLAAAGSGLYRAGFAGNNLLYAGTGATTLAGATSGDTLFAAGKGGDVLFAGTGNETLSAGGSTGPNMFYAGAGQDLIAGGVGSDTLVGGAGNATMFGGGGINTYAFTKGSAGGTDMIADFQRGADRVALSGYGSSAVAALVAGQVNAAGSTTVTLSDSTKIIFLSVNHIDATSFASS